MNTVKFDEIISITNDKLGYDCHIALIGTKRGPAIGGCRIGKYNSTEEALSDAQLLASAMLKKATVHELPHGGGKAVINLHENHASRTAILSDYATIVNKLSGQYITAVDSGSSNADMDIIENTTPYVLCTSKQPQTAYYTARGVYLGLKAAAETHLGKSLQGQRFNIQGIGNVGSELIHKLVPHSKSINICDISETRLQPFKHHNVLDNKSILSHTSDFFIPCALGGVINQHSLTKLDTKVICGAANNQLTAAAMDAFIAEKGILYLPDFLVNGGGLIYASNHYNNKTSDEIDQSIDNMFDRIKTCLEKSAAANISPLKWIQSNILN